MPLGFWWGLTFELTGPEQGGGICASVFACTNTGTLCRVRLSDVLGHADRIIIMLWTILTSLCVVFYGAWNWYWLTSDRLDRRDVCDLWFYGEIALLNLVHGTAWGWLLSDWGIL